MQTLEAERAGEGVARRRDQKFAATTLAYIPPPRPPAARPTGVPDVGIDLKGRHVLIVCAVATLQEDLAALVHAGSSARCARSRRRRRRLPTRLLELGTSRT
jgi:uncharacterized membrane-anchored protein